MKMGFIIILRLMCWVWRFSLFDLEGIMLEKISKSIIENTELIKEKFKNEIIEKYGSLETLETYSKLI